MQPPSVMRRFVVVLGVACACHEVPEAREAAIRDVRPPATDGVRPGLPAIAHFGDLQPVAALDGPMPTGVAVSRSGRIFVTFPRWGDPVPFTLAEVDRGRAKPYPDMATNALPQTTHLSQRFVSMDGIVVDARDRLWALDTGSLERQPPLPGGAKLVAIELATNRIVRTITFPSSIALPGSYLGDLRIDLRRGTAGVAYLTDSSDQGANAVIVVDLASGTSQRRLVDHPSLAPDPQFRAFVEGRPLVVRDAQGAARPPRVGADALALSPDGATLYFCPRSGRRLFSVPTDALVDPTLPASEIGPLVRDLGEKGAADGLETDAQGRIYLALYEQEAIARVGADGELETVVADPRLLWPDALTLADDGYLYVTASQVHRQARYRGTDQRERPYGVFRVHVDGLPGPARTARVP